MSTVRKTVLILVSAFAFAVRGAMPTTLSYVQDGLVGQWDGIENVGRGTHSGTPTVWVNLCGGDINFPMAGCIIGEDSVTIPSGVSPQVDGKSIFGSTTVAAGTSQPMTIELVWQIDGNLTYEYYLLTLDETYLYRQNNTEIIVPYGHRTNASGNNKDWNKFAYSEAELNALSRVSIVNTAAADSGATTLTYNGTKRTRTGTAATSKVDTWNARTHLIRTTTARNFKVVYKAIRVYNRALTAAEQAANAKIDAVRFFGETNGDMLTVTGSPSDCGTVSPAYGETTGHTVGETFTCTAPSWTNAEEGVAAECVGYTVTADDEVCFKGEGNSFEYTHPDCIGGATLVWQWDNLYHVTTAANDGGTVTAVDVWKKSGETVEIAATPNAGFDFAGWIGNLPAGCDPYSPLVEVTVGDTPIALTAAFVRKSVLPTTLSYVKDGLVGQWDGIENVSRGTHSDTPSVWVNLCGGDINFPMDGCEIGADSVTIPTGVSPQVDGKSILGLTSAEEGIYQPMTVELVWQIDGNVRTSPDYFLFTVDETYFYFQDADTVTMSYCHPFENGINKTWNKFPYSNAERKKFSQISFANKADATGASAVLTYDGDLRLRSKAAHTDLIEKWHPRTELVQTADARDFNVVYKAIRVYNRALSREEQELNRATDILRFADDPSTAELPAGWRYDEEKGLQYGVTINVKGNGAVAVDGGEQAATQTVWYAAGQVASLSLASRPGADSTFANWVSTGGALADSKAAETVLSNVQGPVTVTCWFNYAANVRTLPASRYLDHGLVAHWDAIENGAYGLHDAAATAWVELRNREMNFPVEGCTVGEDTLTIPSGVAPQLDKSVFGSEVKSDQPYTVELVWNLSSTNCWTSDLFLFTMNETYFYFQEKCPGQMTASYSFRDVDSHAGKGWGRFPYSADEVVQPKTVSFVNGTTGAGCAYLRLDGGAMLGHYNEIASGSVNPIRQRTALVLSDTPRDYDVVYRAIRIYNRVLTPEEQEVNRAIDEIRFFGKTPDEVKLPAGYRFDDETNLEYRVSVVANGAGSATVNGASEVWLKRGQQDVELTLAATDGAGVFSSWRTTDGEVDETAEKSTVLRLGEAVRPVRVTADFAGEAAVTVPLARRNYVKDGLVLCLDGYENAGAGRHDVFATSWVNLVEGQPVSAVPLAGCRVGANSVEVPSGVKGAISGISPFGELALDSAYQQPMTIEVVWSCDRWFDCGGNSAGNAPSLLTVDETSIMGYRSSAAAVITSRWFEDGERVKDWSSFDYGVRDIFAPHCLSYVNPATGEAALGLKINGADAPFVASAYTQRGEGLTSNSRRFMLAFTADRQCVPTYRSIRVYNRVLTEDERKINYAVDQVRFFGVPPVEAQKLLPKGYMFTKEGDVSRRGLIILFQ